MNFSVDQIIDLIRAVVQSAAPEAILAVVTPFLPKPVAAVLGWAIAHKDCLDELLEALRGAFGADVDGKLNDILPDIEACKQLA